MLQIRDERCSPEPIGSGVEFTKRSNAMKKDMRASAAPAALNPAAMADEGWR